MGSCLASRFSAAASVAAHTDASDAAAVATRNGNPGRAKRAFVKLTKDLCCDIVVDMRSLSLGAMNLSPAVVLLLQLLGFFQPKQRGTAQEQRTPPLFLRSPNRRRPRISAEKEMSTSDNLPQKQQKQREVPRAV
jgi:hypothetical protein